MGVPGTDWSDFVTALPSDMKVEVSLQAVHRLRFHTFTATKDRRDTLQELEQKLLKDQAVIVVNKFHEVQKGLLSSRIADQA